MFLTSLKSVKSIPIFKKLNIHWFRFFKNCFVADLTHFCTANCLSFIVPLDYLPNEQGDPKFFFTSNDVDLPGTCTRQVFFKLIIQ